MTSRFGYHEDFQREHATKTASDRSFGLTIGGALIVLAVIRVIFAAGAVDRLTLAFAIMGFVVAIVGLLMPPILHPLNVAWTKFGLLLHRIVSPVLLGLIFFGTVAPVGLVMRLFGRRPLFGAAPEATTYWRTRIPRGPTAASMTDQF